MKNRFSKLLILIVALALCVCVLVACNNDEGSDDSQDDMLIVSTSLDWKEDGNYSGQVVLGEDNCLLQTDLDKDDFTLSVSGVSASEADTALSDFTVTVKDSKTVEFTFNTPYSRNIDLSYILLSKSGVCGGNSQFGVIILINRPQVGIENLTCEGTHVGSSEIKATLELERDAAFALNLSESMFSVPDGVGEVLDVDRLSDKKAKITIGNIPKSFSSEYFYMQISSSSINSPYAEDVSVVINYVQPQISLSDVTYNEETHIVSVGKASLPDGISGAENGVTEYDDSMTSIVSQSYSAKDNYYSFSMQLNETSLSVYGEKNLLELAYANVKLITESETFDYKLNPYIAKAMLIGNTEIDIDNDIIEISLKVISGSFKEGLTLADFSVVGNENLTNFKLKYIDDTTAVFSADYTSAIEEATTISINLDNSKINAKYGDEDYSAVIFIQPYNDGRVDVDVSFGKLPQILMAGEGQLVSRLSSGLLLPYVFNILDIDIEVANASELKNTLLSLQTAFDGLSGAVKDNVAFLKGEAYQTLFADYLKTAENLRYLTNAILSKDGTAEYLLAESAAQTENLKNHASVQAYYEWLEAKASYEKFEEYVTSCGVTSSPLGDMRGLYNAYVRLIAQHGKSTFEKLFESTYSHNADDGNYLDVEIVYSLCNGKTRYTEVYSQTAVAQAQRNGYVSAFAQSNTENEYINAVVALGEKLLSDTNEFETDVLSLYFNAIDSVFNFSSQTFPKKDAFVSYAYVNYLLGATVAIEYCELANATESLAKLRDQSALVIGKICEKYQKDMAKFGGKDLHALETANLDILLVHPTMVYKNMLNHNFTMKKFFYESQLYLMMGIGVKYQYIQTMMKRAADRGLSLAEDLISAGFTGVNHSENGSSDYIFACNGGYKVDDEYFRNAPYKEVAQKVLEKGYILASYFTTDLVIQNGTDAPVVRLNETYAKWYACKPAPFKTDFEGNAQGLYGTILTFSFTKEVVIWEWGF